MRKASLLLLSTLLCGRPGAAQEAASGVDLRATLSGQLVASSIFSEPGVSEPPVGAGFRAAFYPTFKLGDRWTVTGAWQLYSRPYFFDDFDTPGHGTKGDILQATLNYSRVSERGSLLVRAGELSTCFGSFLLRYDDADNWLVDLPPGYGYYYAPVSILGVAGAQIDATRGKFDGRAQFANSSPANPRSIFAHDQYGNWAGGGGYTIRQGLRAGVSAYRGPYLDHDDGAWFPKGKGVSRLPAHALGADVEWAHGHWNVQAEFQRFAMPYAYGPAGHEDAGYAEVRRVLNPRWYIAARGGYTSANEDGSVGRLELAAGLRPNRFQLLKFEYEFAPYSEGSPSSDKTFAVQFVTTLHRSYAQR
jgi:hypothetical protein